MAERDRYEPGIPSFIDLATSDQGAAKAFYGALFGWSYDDLAMGDQGTYSMAKLRDRTVGAIAPQQPEQAAAGVPPHWQMYITVADVDAAAAKAATANGACHAGPFDVFDAGRMAVLTDPAGAFFMLWQPNNSIGSEIVNEPGTFTWSELVADLSAPDALREVSDFYTAVAGIELNPMTYPDGSAYVGFRRAGTDEMIFAGSMAPQMPGVPPHWSIYFGSADVDADTRRVGELGGQVFVQPFDIPVGRMAVCADPQGATFNLVQFPES
jgi:predicted enzyme related to lactoylglutathione lyase